MARLKVWSSFHGKADDIVKIDVNEGELSILQHSFLLGTDALDIAETALKLGSHGQKNLYGRVIGGNPNLLYIYFSLNLTGEKFWMKILVLSTHSWILRLW